MFRPPAFALATLLLAGLGACDRNAGSVGCGIDAFTGPLVVKESFGKGAVLTALPEVAPAALPVRLVAGRAWRGTVTSDDSGRWRITAHGPLAKEAHVTYGVLVIDYSNRALGVYAFDGQTVRGAGTLGTLAIGDTVVPLLGVRIDPTQIQNEKCPVFPDSLR